MADATETSCPSVLNYHEKLQFDLGLCLPLSSMSSEVNERFPGYRIYKQNTRNIVSETHVIFLKACYIEV